MRISDWSSDVCSSDLGLAPYLFAAAHAPGASISDVVRWVDTQDQTEVGPILEDAAEALVADLPEPSAGDATVDAYRQTLTAGTEPLARALLAAHPSGSMLAETPADARAPEAIGRAQDRTTVTHSPLVFS